MQSVTTLYQHSLWGRGDKGGVDQNKPGTDGCRRAPVSSKRFIAQGVHEQTYVLRALIIHFVSQDAIEEDVAELPCRVVDNEVRVRDPIELGICKLTRVPRICALG